MLCSFACGGNAEPRLPNNRPRRGRHRARAASGRRHPRCVLVVARFVSSPALAAAERGPHSTAGWLRRHFMKAFLQFSQGHRGLLGVPHASGLSRGAAPRGATAVWQTVPSQSNEHSPSNEMVKRFETCRRSFTRGSPGSQYQNIFRSSFISPPRVRFHQSFIEISSETFRKIIFSQFGQQFSFKM